MASACPTNGGCYGNQLTKLYQNPFSNRSFVLTDRRPKNLCAVFRNMPTTFAVFHPTFYLHGVSWDTMLIQWELSRGCLMEEICRNCFWRHVKKCNDQIPLTADCTDQLLPVSCFYSHFCTENTNWNLSRGYPLRLFPVSYIVGK